MGKATAPDVARLLLEYGRRATLAGGNPYRAKAYLRAAESLAAQTEPLDRLIKEDRLHEIPGVGDAISEIITTLARTGTHPALEKMRADIPEGVLDMLAIPGLRPEKIIKLYKELGVLTLHELEAAAKEGRIKEVKGLGAALQRKILQGLAIRRDSQGARHVHRAEELIANATESLKRSGMGITKIVTAGDFRRGSELVVDLALVAQTASLEDRPKRLTAGEFTIFLTNAKRFGISHLLATGSEAHLRELEEVGHGEGSGADGRRTSKRRQNRRLENRARNLQDARPSVHPARTARRKR